MEGQEPLGKLSDIDGLKIVGENFVIDGVKFQPNRVSLDKTATLEGWSRSGVLVQRAQQSNLWWLGDWALAGEEKFGEDAAQYISAEHFAESYLKRARWVCSKIEPTRRIKELSFEHHAAVGGLEASEQDRWLKRAAEKNLTVQDLRRAMRKSAHKKRYVEEDMPEGRYRVLYVDPPWQYDDSGSIPGPNGGSEAYGKAERHYPTMPLDKIKELPVKDITGRNAALFLWVPTPLLPDAIEVLAAWGFIYKTCLIWDKQAHNFGHYVSVRHEILILATHGKMVPDAEVANTINSVQSIARSDVHSEKPEEFRTIIDTLYPAVKARGRNDRIELFARRAADGWDQWGNETRTPVDGKAAAAGETDDAPDDQPVDADVEQKTRRQLRAV
jgi:N6-adenosine-specific RNA methylase IME4